MMNIRDEVKMHFCGQLSLNRSDVTVQLTCVDYITCTRDLGANLLAGFSCTVRTRIRKGQGSQSKSSEKGESWVNHRGGVLLGIGELSSGGFHYPLCRPREHSHTLHYFIEVISDVEDLLVSHPYSSFLEVQHRKVGSTQRQARVVPSTWPSKAGLAPYGIWAPGRSNLALVPAFQSLAESYDTALGLFERISGENLQVDYLSPSAWTLQARRGSLGPSALQIHADLYRKHLTIHQPLTWADDTCARGHLGACVGLWLSLSLCRCVGARSAGSEKKDV